MKLRTGFISNSSSSSFILIGFELPKEFYRNKEKLTQLALSLKLVTNEELSMGKFLGNSIIAKLEEVAGLIFISSEKRISAFGIKINTDRLNGFPLSAIQETISAYYEALKTLGIKEEVKIFHGEEYY